MLLKGVRWQVGNGKGINFWGSPWILSSSNFFVYEAKGLFAISSLVSDFISNGK